MARNNYQAGIVITGDASGGIRAIQKTGKELNELEQRFQRGASQSKKFGTDVSSVSQQLHDVDESAGAASGGLEVLRTNLGGVAAAMATAFGAGSIIQQAGLIADTDTLAKSIGVATGELQAWDYASQQAGLSAGAIGDILKDVAERIGEFSSEGTGEAAALFENLNLQVEEMRRLSPDQQLLKIAGAISELNRNEQISYLEKMGNDATRLLPLLENNAAGLKALTNEARSLGVAMDQVDIERAVQADRAMSQLSGTVTGLQNQLAADLGPGLANAVGGLADFIEEAGGAAAVLDTLQSGAALVAGVFAGRYAAAFAASTQTMAANTAATLAQAQADVAATAAARAKTAETLRVAVSEQAAAKRAFENARATAAATGNTTLRTKAITQLAAANQRAIGAEAAHTAAVNANAAAMARGTVAAQGMAVASRALNGALALVGGPVGAAVIAGAGLYYFREELGLTDSKMQGTVENVEELGSAFIEEFGNLGAEIVGAFRGMRAELVELDAGFLDMKAGALESFTDIIAGSADLINMGLIPIQHALNALDQGFADWINRFANAFESAGEMPFGMANLFGEQVSRMRSMADGLTEGMIEPIGISTTALESNAQAWREQAEAMRGSAENIRNGVNPAASAALDIFKPLSEWLFEVGDASEDAGNKAADAADKTTTLADAYESLLDRIQPNRRAARQYAQDVGTLNLALATGRMTAQQYMQAMGMLQESFQAAQRDTTDIAEVTDVAADEMARAWEEATNRIDETFSDAFAGAFDSFDSFADSLLDGFKRLLAELAYQATLKPIVVQFTQQMGGALGIPGAGGQQGVGGGMNLSPGGIGNAWSAVQSGFGGIQWTGASNTAYAGNGWANAATQGTGATGFMGGSTANFSGATGLASLGAGFAGSYAGTELGSSVFGREANSNYGSMAGGAIGTYLGGPVGAFLGSTLGGLADSLFGSSKKTFDFDFLQGQHSYVFGDRTSAFGDSGLTALSDYKLGEQQDQLNDMLTAMANFDNQLAAAAIPERFEAMKASIDGFTHSGPDDLFETRLRQMITGGQVLAADAVASIIDPERLSQAALGALQLEGIGQQLGEQALSDITAEIERFSGDSVVDAITSMTNAAMAADLLASASQGLNLQFDVTAAGAVNAAGSIAEMVGGMQNLAAIQQGYYQAAYSETERLSRSQTDLRAALEGITDQVPTTVGELRALVEAQNLNDTAAGELAVRLMELAPALKQTNDAVRDAITQQYQDVLGRAPDASGLEYWFDRVASGSLTLEGALWNISNSAEAAEYATKGASEAFGNMAQILREREQLERQLLQLQGDTNALRRLELEDLDPSNRYLQQRIWAIEDERAAMREAERAQQERIRALEQEARTMMSAGQNIRQFVESLQNTAGAGLSPETAYQNAEASFLAAISTIYTSDDSALVQDTINGITGIAQQYLSAAEAYGASGNIYQQARALVEGSLDDLAGRLGSDELTDIDPQLEKLIQGMDLLNESIAKMTSDLNNNFDMLDTSLDGVIDFEEFKDAFGDILSNDQLDTIFNSLDANMDGVLSATEAAAANTGLQGPLAKQVPLAQTFAEFFGGNGSQNYMYRQIGALAEIEKAINELDLIVNVEGQGTTVGGGSGGSNIDTSPSQPVGTQLDKNQVEAILSSQTGSDLSRMFGSGALGREGWSTWWELIEFAGKQNSSVTGFSENGVRLSTSADEIRSALGFSESNYFKLNPDIAAAVSAGDFGSGLHHYLRHGVGEGRRFYTGGYTGPGGKYEPAGIVHRGEVVWSQDDISAWGGVGVVESLRNGAVPLPAPLPMPNLPLPQFPALGQNDVAEVLRDLKREVSELRKENARLQGASNQHLEAANVQRGAAATQQIAAIERGNKFLKRMEDDKRLEAVKR